MPCKHIMFRPLAVGDFGLSWKKHLQNITTTQLLFNCQWTEVFDIVPKTKHTARESKAEAVAAGIQIGWNGLKLLVNTHSLWISSFNSAWMPDFHLPHLVSSCRPCTLKQNAKHTRQTAHHQKSIFAPNDHYMAFCVAHCPPDILQIIG